MTDSTTPPEAPTRQPGQGPAPGYAAAVGPVLQSRFVHAAEYASLVLQMVDHVFPGQRYMTLTPDQRRIVSTEAENLLLQARWRVESKGFADLFALPQTPDQSAPAGTVLGDPPPPQAPAQGGQGGGYL